MESSMPDIKGRKVTIKFENEGDKDNSTAFLRILAKGDVDGYIKQVIKECMKT